MDKELFYYCVEETKLYELHDINGLYRTEYNKIVVKNFVDEECAIECLNFLNNLNRPKYKYNMRKIIIKNPKLYLAGCNTDYWQEHISELINKKFKILNKQNELFNVEWEHKLLQESNIILFWFPKDMECPITLYNLGVWSSQTLVPIVIAVHPEYKLRNEIIKRMNLRGFCTVDSLEKAADIINNSYCKFFKYDEYKDNHFSNVNDDNQDLTLFRKDRKEQYRKLIYQITNPEINTEINPEINTKVDGNDNTTKTNTENTNTDTETKVDGNNNTTKTNSENTETNDDTTNTNAENTEINIYINKK